MGDKLLWISMHAVCIGSHLGLVVAGLYSLVSCRMDTGHDQQGCAWDEAAVVISWTAFGVVGCLPFANPAAREHILADAYDLHRGPSSWRATSNY